MKKLAALTILACLAAPVFADIASTSGSVTEVPPPSDVAHGQTESDTQIIVFAEQKGAELSSDLVVNIVDTGTYTGPSATLTPGTIGSGTPVNSYLLHFDPVTGSTDLTGSVTFEEPVLGLIVLSPTLAGSDFLGASGTSYPGDTAGRRMELLVGNPTTLNDEVILSGDRKTVTITGLTNETWQDQVRIITAAPKRFPLCAGQSIEVGQVIVWNDCDNLYVRFITEDGWEMSETHLHVDGSSADVPQTKKNNPIPGQFDYQRQYDLRVTEDTYEVSLSALPDTVVIVIAAHAVVLDTTSVVSGGVDLISGKDSGITVYGPLTAYAPPGDGSWPTGQSPVVVTKHPAWRDVPGAAWITALVLPNPNESSWQWFSQEFSLPYTAHNISGGPLTANSDNAERVWMNDAFIGEVGDITDTVDPADRSKHLFVTEYDVISDVKPGVNVLEVIVRNYNPVNPDPGNPPANPTALAYKGTITYDYYDTEESAWGDGCEGTSFPGKNWATYFNYTVQECAP